MISIASQQPPFVRFEEREHGINADASEKAGRPIPAVHSFALITPHGSKDCVEKFADEWIAQIREKALRGEYPPQWYEHFKLQYEEWKKGNELPRNGSPVKTWNAISKEQQVRLIALGYTVIEDLAQVPDGGLSNIGLDGRYLRDLARAWLNEGDAAEKGRNARKLADQSVEIDRLKVALEEQQELVRALKARLDESDEKKTRKRGEAA